MNDILSLGIHRCWKDTFVKDIGVIKNHHKDSIYDDEPNQARSLDVAGGTGDIAFRMIDAFNAQSNIIES